MPKLFIGRDEELKELEDLYKQRSSKLIVLYGRRRIGKSTLVSTFIEHQHKINLCFEGLENKTTQEQIKHFLSELSKQVQDQFINKLQLKSWEEVFLLLTEIIEKNYGNKKVVIFIDEIQWMAAKRSSLISLIKYFWDKYWLPKSNIMLILCGSLASFMVNKVIKSKALYGRIDKTMLLQSLSILEAKQFFKKGKDLDEILKYLLVFGTIPKYLTLIDQKKSFAQNIEDLCFKQNGYMFQEPEKIFYSQFKETETYLAILQFLEQRPHTYKEIIDSLKVSSGGGFKTYLDNLKDAEIIQSFQPSVLLHDHKSTRYKITDEFFSFYFKFMKPYLSIIEGKKTQKNFHKLVEKSWLPWLGISFEKFCIKHALYLAELMGFADEVTDYSAYYQRQSEQVQIDLLYVRSDQTITICEVKYHNQKISTKIIPEFNRKLELIKIPQGYSVNKALISLHGMDKALEETEYFDYSLDINDIFGQN